MAERQGVGLQQAKIGGSSIKAKVKAFNYAAQLSVPSVCPSVRHSVTFRYYVQTNEDTIVWFSASGRIILLVSEEVKFI